MAQAGWTITHAARALLPDDQALLTAAAAAGA